MTRGCGYRSVKCAKCYFCEQFPVDRNVVASWRHARVYIPGMHVTHEHGRDRSASAICVCCCCLLLFLLLYALLPRCGCVWHTAWQRCPTVSVFAALSWRLDGTHTRICFHIFLIVWNIYSPRVLDKRWHALFITSCRWRRGGYSH